ncbi:hypothetical protein C8R44DRAFT_130026 [Mycena epipterygia]|nr:hypothetical protein C8R44DRAFT_130026 [Mycena epipterygia]
MQGGSAPVSAGPMGDPPDVAKAFATQLVYRSSLGALTFLLYDICITMDDEVKFVWPKQWTRMKFIYLFIRYIPLFIQISILPIGSPELTPHFHFTPHACFVWQVYQGVATLLVFSAVDYILILRVYALYHTNARVRRLVLAAFGLEVSVMGIGLGLSLPGIQFDDICLVTRISDLLLIYAGATLLFQTLLFGLTAVKFVRALREGWGDTPLVGLVMRDGTWAFILLFAAVGGDASLYTVKNHAIAGVLYGWLLTIFSFSGYRVLLNLDRLGDNPRLPTSMSSTHDSRLQFTTRIVTDREPAAPNSYELSTLNTSSSGTGGG